MLNPETQFAESFTSAQEQLGEEAARCVLATCSQSGQPSARVLFHRPGASGRVRIFTNYESRKGDEIAANAQVAVVFHWHPLLQQVRLEGQLEKVSAADSDAYFDARPLSSRWASALSPQSRTLRDMVALMQEHETLLASSKNPTRPAHWGGYELIPHRIEFWQAGDARLHTRSLFTRSGAGWREQTLAP